MRANFRLMLQTLYSILFLYFERSNVSTHLITYSRSIYMLNNHPFQCSIWYLRLGNYNQDRVLVLLILVHVLNHGMLHVIRIRKSMLSYSIRNAKQGLQFTEKELHCLILVEGRIPCQGSGTTAKVFNRLTARLPTNF